MKGVNIITFLLVFLIIVIFDPGYLFVTNLRAADARWGLLANEGFDRHHIRATLFFPGQARDGSSPYECNPASNMFLYTVHPQDSRHLNWARSRQNRDFVVDRMIGAGINVAVMSSWGEDFLPCSTAWTPWAPMQCSTQSHDELFSSVAGKHLLIIPFIESRADWSFRDEFPTWDGQIAPGTVSQIVNFINRYINGSQGRIRRDSWARVYNRNGQARYAVALIHASSNRLGPNEHSAFANGFDSMAEEVRRRTGIDVGFFLDVLPPNTNAPGVFRPSYNLTAYYLKQQDSILGIMCFIPEVWVGSSSDQYLINWKQRFSRGWAETDIPFLMDISPGYDAHIVFPNSVQYGLNDSWMQALTEMVQEFGDDGLMYNSWNGYTEGMAAVVLQEHGDKFYEWLRELTCGYEHATCSDLIRCEGRAWPSDLNGDCKVDFLDLAELLSHWMENYDPQNTSGSRDR
ncbi:MAG: hypothetical protein PVH77_09560 [Phycisphaerales bacterium]|jgi:hypothetical protein